MAACSYQSDFSYSSIRARSETIFLISRNMAINFLVEHAWNVEKCQRAWVFMTWNNCSTCIINDCGASESVPIWDAELLHVAVNFSSIRHISSLLSLSRWTRVGVLCAQNVYVANWVNYSISHNGNLLMPTSLLMQSLTRVLNGGTRSKDQRIYVE